MSSTLDAQGRLSALVRHDTRPARQWAALLDVGEQGVRDRIKGRVRWTLADALAIAEDAGLTVDSIIRGDDMPIGWALTPSTPGELPRTGAAYIDQLCEPEAIAAQVAALHLHPAPRYEDVDR